MAGASAIINPDTNLIMLLLLPSKPVQLPFQMFQVYFQRVLSAKTARKAQILSFSAAIGCILLSIPPALAGIVAQQTEWNNTGFNYTKLLANKQLVLPLVGHATESGRCHTLSLCYQPCLPSFMFGSGAGYAVSDASSRRFHRAWSSVGGSHVLHGQLHPLRQLPLRPQHLPTCIQTASITSDIPSCTYFY